MLNNDPSLYSNPFLANYECEGQLSIEDCFPTVAKLGENKNKNNEVKEDGKENSNV